MTGYPQILCCCETECDDCSFCPGENDEVYVVLTNTNADGIYLATWNAMNSNWDIDFGLCATSLECNPDGTGLNWGLFNDAECPIGGRCDVGSVNEGSPLLITPAPDCDNCELGLHNGTLAIYWTCTGASMMMASAPQLKRSVVEECVHRGKVVGVHDCEVCGRRGTQAKVYECALHGKCVLKNWTNDGKKRREAGEKCCLTCPDKQPPKAEDY